MRLMETRRDRLYDCVVFDLDGTLLDTRDAMIRAINTVLNAKPAAALTANDLSGSMHHGLSAMLQEALQRKGLQFDRDSRRALYLDVSREYIASAPQWVRPFPGVEELLRALRASGVWTGVCTNQFEDDARGILERFDLTGGFSEVVGRDTLAFHKPHPMPLIWLMGRSGARQRGTLMVGDSDVDVQCAGQAGVPIVLMEHGYGLPTAPHAHATSRDFASLRRRICPE